MSDHRNTAYGLYFKNDFWKTVKSGWMIVTRHNSYTLNMTNVGKYIEYIWEWIDLFYRLFKIGTRVDKNKIKCGKLLCTITKNLTLYPQFIKLVDTYKWIN